MENYNYKYPQKIKKGFRCSNLSNKMILKHYNPITKKLLFQKKLPINKFLYKNNRLNAIINNKINKKNFSTSSVKKTKRSIAHFCSESRNFYHKKNKSLNNISSKHISKLKNKLFTGYKDIKTKNAPNNKNIDKQINYSFTNHYIKRNNIYKKIIPDFYNNTLIDKNSLYMANLLPLNKEKNTKLNHIMKTEPYSFINYRNKTLLKSETYNNLEIICEGNNINNIGNNITFLYRNKKNEISPKINNNLFKMFENKKMKKIKSNNSFLLLTSINNNYTNILNYNYSKKKFSKKKKMKIKLNKSHNKTLKENEIKYKLNDLKEKMEKLFEENEIYSKNKKYSIIKDKFDESLNIMGLNKEEKKFLKLLMDKYDDIISCYSKENKMLKKKSEHFQNINYLLDKKYSNLKNKFNQNLNLLKHYYKKEKNFVNNQNYVNNKYLNENKSK